MNLSLTFFLAPLPFFKALLKTVVPPFFFFFFFQPWRLLDTFYTYLFSPPPLHKRSYQCLVMFVFFYLFIYFHLFLIPFLSFFSFFPPPLFWPLLPFFRLIPQPAQVFFVFSNVLSSSPFCTFFFPGLGPVYLRTCSKLVAPPPLF